MRLPTEKECYSVLTRLKTPKNVIKHTEKVRQVALFIGQKLMDKGTEIDIRLLSSAALLHDMMRPIDFEDMISGFSEDEIRTWKDIKEKYQGKNHAEAAYDFLKGKYPELALTIKKHLFSAVNSDDIMLRPVTWEEKILNYADKRVAHDRIVTLAERFADGERRWHKEHPHQAQDKIQVKKIWRKHYANEKEIFNEIGLEPKELKKYLRDERE